jgi:aldehyde dehydrogenase (NAD+)
MLDKRKFYINGKWENPLASKDFDVINPSNEEVFAIISLGNITDTNAAVEAAKKSFVSWSKTTKEKKITLLENLYEVYKSRWNEMSEAISLEMGAPID